MGNSLGQGLLGPPDPQAAPPGALSPMAELEHGRSGGRAARLGGRGVGNAIKGDLRVRGREQCRDARDETWTTTPTTTPPAASPPTSPPPRRAPYEVAFEERLGRRGGSQTGRREPPGRLLPPSTQFTAGAPAGIPARPYALRAASITPRRGRGLHGPWEGEEGATEEGGREAKPADGWDAKNGSRAGGFRSEHFCSGPCGAPGVPWGVSACTRASLPLESIGAGCSIQLRGGQPPCALRERGRLRNLPGPGSCREGPIPSCKGDPGPSLESCLSKPSPRRNGGSGEQTIFCCCSHFQKSTLVNKQTCSQETLGFLKKFLSLPENQGPKTFYVQHVLFIFSPRSSSLLKSFLFGLFITREVSAGDYLTQGKAAWFS